MPDKPLPDAAVLDAMLKIEMAADLTEIMAETDVARVVSAIAALQLRMEDKMRSEGDTDAALHAQIMSERIQDAWVALRRTAGEA